MSKTKRQFVIAIGVTVILALTALWSVASMFSQRTAARYAAEDLAASQQLADRIASLKQQPTIAAAEDMGIRELDPKIETALQAAGLPRRPTIEGIFPQSTRPLGDVPYQIKPTSVSIRSVTLAQLATFLYHLSDGSGLVVRDLRLRSPRAATAGQLWDAEATLTYLIYAPTDTR